VQPALGGRWRAIGSPTLQAHADDVVPDGVIDDGVDRPAQPSVAAREGEDV